MDVVDPDQLNPAENQATAENKTFLLKEILDDKDPSSSHFVAFNVTFSPNDPTDSSLATANVTILSSTNDSCWTFQGLTEDDLGTTIPLRMRHAIEALTPYLEAKEEYKCGFTVNESNNLLVEVEWDAAAHAKDYIYRLHFEANKVEKAEAVSQGVFDAYLEQFDRLREKETLLQNHHEAIMNAVSSKEDVATAFASKKQSDYRESIVKMGALLSSKREKRQQLEKQLNEIK